MEVELRNAWVFWGKKKKRLKEEANGSGRSSMLHAPWIAATASAASWRCFRWLGGKKAAGGVIGGAASQQEIWSGSISWGNSSRGCVFSPRFRRRDPGAKVLPTAARKPTPLMLNKSRSERWTDCGVRHWQRSGLAAHAPPQAPRRSLAWRQRTPTRQRRPPAEGSIGHLGQCWSTKPRECHKYRPTSSRGRGHVNG